MAENTQLIDHRVIKNIAKSYSTLNYYAQLQGLVKSILPTKNVSSLSKYDLHKLLNQVLFDHYNGEEILKYKLCSLYFDKPKVIGAFEIKVNKSRVDFLTINGSTTSYEIKSELDNLNKLKKQASDYLQVFDYNYLVIDKRHIARVSDTIPDSFGLWSYDSGTYLKLRRPKLNTAINPEMQLRLLTKKEIQRGFNMANGTVKSVLNLYSASGINKEFKKTLKLRYFNRWQFLREHYTQILPLDFQFFFNTNINPAHIYNH